MPTDMWYIKIKHIYNDLGRWTLTWVLVCARLGYQLMGSWAMDMYRRLLHNIISTHQRKWKMWIVNDCFFTHQDDCVICPQLGPLDHNIAKLLNMCFWGRRRTYCTCALTVPAPCLHSEGWLPCPVSRQEGKAPLYKCSMFVIFYLRVLHTEVIFALWAEGFGTGGCVTLSILVLVVEENKKEMRKDSIGMFACGWVAKGRSRKESMRGGVEEIWSKQYMGHSSRPRGMNQYCILSCSKNTIVRSIIFYIFYLVIC